MTPLADMIGPLAEGVILLGIVPAAVLVVVMVTVSRVVEWRASRGLTRATTGPGRQLAE